MDSSVTTKITLWGKLGEMFEKRINTKFFFKAARSAVIFPSCVIYIGLYAIMKLAKEFYHNF